MSIDALVEDCRAEYQTHLRSVAAVERTKHPELVTELAIRINDECWDDRSLLVRIDMVWGDASQPVLTNAELNPIEIRTDEYPSESIVEDVVVKASKFRWHASLVRLRPRPASWSPMWQWFDSWFDLQGLHQPDADGFESVIHGISCIEFEADGTCVFTVDFGSAPTVCVMELVRACGRAGIRELCFS
jgi:hypothetical protein